MKPWQPPTFAPTPEAVDDRVDGAIDEAVETAVDEETLDQVGDEAPAGQEIAVVEEDASGLPSMADLDRLSAGLDEIDATLARMDAGKTANAGSAPVQPTFGGDQLGNS